MKKLINILVIMFLPLVSAFAAVDDRKAEIFAMGGIFLAAGLSLFLFYYILKRKAVNRMVGMRYNKQKEKIVSKTYQIVQNGKKIVLVKNFRVPVS